MGNYNPDTSCTSGLQWFARRNGVATIDSSLRNFGAVLHAATSDSVKNLWIAHYSADPTTNGTLQVLDVTAGLPDPGSVTTLTFYPGGDLYNAPPPNAAYAWGPTSSFFFVTTSAPINGHGPQDIWPMIANPTLSPGTVWPLSGRPIQNNALQFNIFGAGAEYAASFAGVAGTFAGTWIAKVSCYFSVNMLNFGTQPATSMTITPYVQVRDLRYYGSAQTFPDEIVGGHVFTFDWFANPEHGRPWTPADLDDFDVGGSSGIGYVVQASGSFQNVATIMQVQLKVDSAPTDPRVGMGALQIGSGFQQGWHLVIMRDPQTGDPADLALTAGNDYLFLWTKPVGGAYQLTLLDDPDGNFLPGPPTWTNRPITLSTTTALPIKMGDDLPQCMGIVLQKDDDSLSLDSQPYAFASPLPVGTQYRWSLINGLYETAKVDVDHSLEQEITPGATQSYPWLWVVCAQQNAVATEPLVIKVRRRSDDVQFGSTVTITADDLPNANKQTWQKVGVRFTSAPNLVSGTKYWFDVTSAAEPGSGWGVCSLDSGYPETPPLGPPAGSDLANFGGTDDILTAYGTDVPEADAIVSVNTIPDPVTGLEAHEGGPLCDVDWVVVMWDPSDPIVGCGDFDYYEVQRADDGVNYKTIAKITDQTVGSMIDQESIVNQVADYRIRQVRGDGVPSDWSATASATAVQTHFGLQLTTNEDPDLALFAVDVGDARTYTFVENTAIVQGYDRNFQQAFRELENRGTVFSVVLLVRNQDPICALTPCDPVGFGTDVFAPVRRLRDADLSYVCVRNEVGNRWFANMQLGQANWQPLFTGSVDGYYSIAVTFTEVTDTPSNIDSSSGGSGS